MLILDRSLYSLSLLVFFLLLLCLAAAALAEGDQPTTTTKTAPERNAVPIEVDLSAGTFSRSLPFERLIRFGGNVPEGIGDELPSGKPAKATLRYFQSRKLLAPGKPEGDDAPSTCQPDWKPVGPKGTRPKDLDTLVFSGTVASTKTTDGKAVNRFLFRVPGVKPNRFFLFCFQFQSTVSDEVLARFQEKAEPLLNQLAASTEPPGGGGSRSPLGEMTEQQAKNLRDSLKAALKAELPSADLTFVEGSFLDDAQTDAAIRGHFTDSFNPIWNAQANIALKLEGSLGNPDVPAIVQGPGIKQWQEGDRNAGIAGLRSLLQNLKADKNLQTMVNTLGTVRKVGGPARDLDHTLGRYEPVLETIEKSNDLISRLLTPDQLELANVRALGESRASDLAKKLAGVARDLGELNALISAVQSDGAVGSIVVRDTQGQEPVTLAEALGDATLTGLRNLEQQISAAESLANNIADNMADIADELRLRDRAFTAMVKTEMQVIKKSTFLVDGDSVLSDTDQAAYYSVDSGLVAVPVLEEVVPYAGVNFYLRPINPPTITPLGGSLLRRLAFTFGLTFDSIGNSRTIDGEMVKTVDNLFGNQSLMLGAGLRLNRMIRLGAGALLFRKRDDLLDQDLSLTTTYYISLSFDLDVASALSGAPGRLFNGGNGSADDKKTGN